MPSPVDIVVGVTHVAVRSPFANASPAEIRAVLLEDERPRFDQDYRHALDAARNSYSLDELEQTLEWWGRTAALTHADPVAYRRMRERAERRAATGEAPAGSETWGQLRDKLGL